MIDWRLLASARFWFSIGWNPLQFKTAIIMTAVFCSLFVAGVVVWALGDSRARKRGEEYRIAMSKLGVPGITVGLLGLLFTFSAYQQIAIFSARFWFLAIFLLFVVWEVFSIRYVVVRVPKKLAARREEAERIKYLPKKKK